MVPTFLIQALFALGGVIFLADLTLFYYFNEKVQNNVIEKMKLFFNSTSTNAFITNINTQNIPTAVLKDFSKDLMDLTDVRRRFRKLLFVFPLIGCLFISSAGTAILELIENDIILQHTENLETLSYSLLLAGIIAFIYSAKQLITLCRELS